jgi:tetratricopeptide (TPR) repeat protein
VEIEIIVAIIAAGAVIAAALIALIPKFRGKNGNGEGSNTAVASGQGSASGAGVTAGDDSRQIVSSGPVTIHERDPVVGQAIAGLLKENEAKNRQLEAKDEQLAAKDRQIEKLQKLVPSGDQEAAITEAIEALPEQSDIAGGEERIERALRLAAKGDARQAEAIFQDVLDREAAAGAEHNKTAAAAARHMGNLAYLRDTAAAIAAFRRATELDPDDLESWYWLADLALLGGDRGLARVAYEALGNHSRIAQNQRYMMVSRVGVGDILRLGGDSVGALTAFREALAIAERRASAESNNAQRQRDLSVSHNRIGDVLRDQGDVGGALESYRADMAIAGRLAATDPDNAEWQRDLSVSHNKIGDVLLAQGDPGGAKESYGAGIAISERLAAADPDNAEWQRDLSVSHSNIGEVLGALGDLGEALERYGAGMAIAGRLAAADPGNAQWQRDLSVSHDKIGEVLFAQGDLGAALESYGAGMAIREGLAAADPDNAEWQTDVVASCGKMGRLLLEDEATWAEAAGLFERGLAILRPLHEAGKLVDYQMSWIEAMENDLAKARGETPDP